MHAVMTKTARFSKLQLHMPADMHVIVGNESDHAAYVAALPEWWHWHRAPKGVAASTRRLMALASARVPLDRRMAPLNVTA